ncbi:MAG: DUF2249 domain-containing protein [Firmicutes bacterium]|nr:DUF2249 domain-containing protein [Bacillota bacterium]
MSEPLSRENSEHALVEQLVTLLIRSLRLHRDQASSGEAATLAAQAWAALRNPYPQLAERLNGTLHYLTNVRFSEEKFEEETETPAGRTLPILDVRDAPPAQRHEQILGHFAALQPGEAFIIVNDHDPKPLYYQLQAEQPGKATWEYLESGPVVWRVRLGRAT